jgi:hypothetical protein
VIPLSLAPLDLSCHKDVTHGHYSPDIGPIAGCARHGHCEIMRRVTLDCLVPRSHYICHWLHVGVDDCILGRSSRLEQHLLPARRGLLEVLRDCIDYLLVIERLTSELGPRYLLLKCGGGVFIPSSQVRRWSFHHSPHHPLMIVSRDGCD